MSDDERQFRSVVDSFRVITKPACGFRFKDYVHVPDYIPGIDELTEEIPVSDDM